MPELKPHHIPQVYYARGAQLPPADCAKYAAWTPDPPRHVSNTAPKGWREVNADYIAQNTRWGMFYPDAVEHRPVAEEGFASVYLHYFFDGTGVAWSVAGGKLRWFIFGCTAPEHTIHFCATCGHKAHFDSSD